MHLMLDPEENSYFCFPESPDVSKDWFADWPDIKFFVIFLDFQFNVLKQQQKNTL